MQKYVIANWKLNPATLDEATTLAKALASGACCIGVAPSFLHLSCVKKSLSNDIVLGVQDITHKTAQIGAFTGDVSACQVKDLGARFTLVGHSERRQYHGENDEILTHKIRHAFDSGLSVIYCIGETKDEYERGDTKTVLERQLALLKAFDKDIFSDNSSGQLPKLIIAYEPVWAIGTGLTPSLDEIQNTHRFISEQLSDRQINSPILYGGSVNDKNASDIASIPLVDGVLVGGASLKIESFSAIIHAFTPATPA